MALFPSTSIPSAAGAGYDIDNSYRVETSWLARTNTTGTAPTKMTMSFWFKRSVLNNCVSGACGWASPTVQYLFTAQTSYAAGNQDVSIFLNGERLALFTAGSQGGLIDFWPKHILRDTAAWYHLCIQLDTTQGTPSERIKMYINGSRVLATDATGWANGFQSGTAIVYPAQNSTWAVCKSGTITSIGGRETAASTMTMGYHGYISDFHLVDGLSLTADEFGETDTDYGHWKPKAYTGSHGTTGYHLDFKDGSSMGNDANGSNNFTVHSIAASDQVTDSPTNNFAVMNTLDNYYTGATYSEGNLKVATGANGSSPASNFGMSSGKWYCEFHCVSDTGNGTIAGITGTLQQATAHEIGHYADGYAMGDAPASGSVVRNNNSNTSYGSGFGIDPGETIGMAIDLDNNRMYWRNDGGAWVNSADPAAGSGGYPESGTLIAPSSGHYYFAVGRWSNAVVTYVLNFGQDGTFAGNKTVGDNADDNGYGNFLYDVPAGFLALCTKNMPDPAVKPREHFGIMLTDFGAGARTFASHGIPAEAKFAPELIWMKSRGSTHNHIMCDIVQGVQKSLSPNVGDAQATGETTGLLSFDSDGFTLGNDGAFVQTAGDGMVYWCWKLGGTASSNTNGSITSSVSANRDAGVSVGTYTGTGANGTIGHGLSKAPGLVVVHAYNSPDSWPTGSIQSIASMDFTDYLRRDNSTAVSACTTCWDNTAPNATKIYLGSSAATNASGATWRFEAYHNVEGYSKIGAYKGNSNVDGTFVYTGFRPKLILIKGISVAEHWQILDSARSPYNPEDARLNANRTVVEATELPTDFLSNGFKMRQTYASQNNSSHTYLYIAFAETPFKYTNAR